MDIIVSKVNESFVEVNADESVLHDLYNRYSEYVSGYMFNPRFKNRIWDGKIHLFNIRSGMLPFGFVRDLFGYAKQTGQTIDFRGISQSDFIEEIDEEEYKNTIEENMKNNELTVRDYQDEAIRAALKNHRGVLLSCTSSGKSLIIYNIIKTLRKRGLKKILLIVPNIMLVEQMYKDFEDYGYADIKNEVEQLGGGNKATFELPVLISTWQSLQNEEPDFFEDYDGVIVDECHRI